MRLHDINLYYIVLFYIRGCIPASEGPIMPRCSQLFCMIIKEEEDCWQVLY